MTGPAGPLAGIRVIEIASLGPGPFAGMLLAGLGADVLRIERPGGTLLGSGEWNLLNRGRPSAAVDLGTADGVELVLDLCEQADALIEGFRPGVTERIGIGPDAAHERNPALVYGRMTGYGQDGPLSQAAGHDINYLAISGILDLMPRVNARPVAPLNLVGDMGGGGMLLALGVVAGVLSARSSGHGQVVDASMVEGASLLGILVRAFANGPDQVRWTDDGAGNFLAGDSHFYGTWRCRDGLFVATGAVEPQFYAALLDGLGLDSATPQWERARWPELKTVVAQRFSTRAQAEWIAIFDGVDACVTPVVPYAAASAHPHNAARGSFVDVGGVVQPRPAPRFSESGTVAPTPPADPGADTDTGLRAWGLEDRRLRRLHETGVIA